MHSSFLLVAVLGASLMAVTEPPSDDAAVLAEMSSRIAAYVTLHRQLEGPVPTIQSSGDADQVRRAVEALGAKIRAARRDARRGSVFTPAVATLLR